MTRPLLSTAMSRGYSALLPGKLVAQAQLPSFRSSLARKTSYDPIATGSLVLQMLISCLYSPVRKTLPEPLDKFDPILLSQVRLGIISVLMTRDDTTFSDLRALLGLTQGNLGSHLQSLESASYVTTDKAFVERKPQTSCKLTAQGRRAFLRHLQVLEEIARRNRYRKAAIHTIEIGGEATGKRWRGFLRQIAEENGGKHARR